MYDKQMQATHAEHNFSFLHGEWHSMIINKWMGQNSIDSCDFPVHFVGAGQSILQTEMYLENINEY